MIFRVFAYSLSIIIHKGSLFLFRYVVFILIFHSGKKEHGASLLDKVCLVIADADTDVFCVIEILVFNRMQDKVSYIRVRWGKRVEFQSSVTNVT